MTLAPEVSARDHHRGPLDAPLVIVHLGDFECPYSGALASVLSQIQAERGDQMCLIFRNFPLVDLHPHALGAALASEAAGDKFWPMHNLLFANQRALSNDDLIDYAGQIGLDRDDFVRVMNADEIAEKVRQSIASGQESGAHGTPSVWINGEFYDNDRQLWKRERLDGAIAEQTQN